MVFIYLVLTGMPGGALVVIVGVWDFCCCLPCYTCNIYRVLLTSFFWLVHILTSTVFDSFFTTVIGVDNILRSRFISIHRCGSGPDVISCGWLGSKHQLPTRCGLIASSLSLSTSSSLSSSSSPDKVRWAPLSPFHWRMFLSKQKILNAWILCFTHRI